MKSTQNLIKADVSTKTIQFDECRRGAMTLDFMKPRVIAPSMHPPKLKSFCWNIWFYKVLGGFHLKSAEFHEICRISWMWAFTWWSSIGLSFERPISCLLSHVPFSLLPLNLILLMLNDQWQRLPADLWLNFPLHTPLSASWSRWRQFTVQFTVKSCTESEKEQALWWKKVVVGFR